MFFSVKDLDDILKSINKNIVYFIASSYEEEYLSESDKRLLREFGIDYRGLYSIYNDHIHNSYNIGMLSQILSDIKMKYIDIEDVKERIRLGKTPKLSFSEREVLKSIKLQSLSDIRSSSGKIFQDINNIISGETANVRADQENYLRTEIYNGVQKKQSIDEISNAIRNKTEDWSRNFKRIVSYTTHKAYSEGSVAVMDRLGAKKVYVRVRQGACSKCINIYLKNGANSESKIFYLDRLKSNGNNHNKKTKDYIPVIPPTHPHCFCDLKIYRDGYEWDRNKKMYAPAKSKVDYGVKVQVFDKFGEEIV